MNFHEKSAWASGLSLCVVFVPYFWVVFQQPLAFFGMFVLAVIVQVGLLVAFHAVNAMATPSIRKSGETPAPDELDRLIELKASKLSGIILAVVVVSWSMWAMVAVLVLGSSEAAAQAGVEASTMASGLVVPVTRALLGVHLLFAGFVLANLAYYGGIVAAYRRLNHG